MTEEQINNEQSEHSFKGNNKLRLISIQSGKGGSGKTLISASVGFLLAHCGFKTLLIDTDLITRGLSFYLMSDEPYRAQFGLSDYLNQQVQLTKEKLVNIHSPFCNSNLFFLPSSSNLQTHKPDHYLKNDFQDLLSSKLPRLFEVAFSQLGIDYIICDTPGGTSSISYTVANKVNGYVIVTEADKTSWDVTELLVNGINEFSEDDTGYKNGRVPARLGFILNKNTLPDKEIVKFLKQRFLCQDLAVIPLDIEAVRCFQNDDIPVDKDISSVFSGKIVDVIEKLFHPEQEWKADSKEIFQKVKSEIKKKHRELEKQKNLTQRMENFRLFLGPFTVALISMIAAIFTFIKIDLSRTTMGMLLLFIAYMATLSAMLSNPKYLKFFFRHRYKDNNEKMDR